MATVKGTYTLRDTLTPFPHDNDYIEIVNFTSRENNFVGFYCTTEKAPVLTLCYAAELGDPDANSV